MLSKMIGPGKPTDVSKLDFGHFCLHRILILCNSLILLKASFISLKRKLLIYKEWPKSKVKRPWIISVLGLTVQVANLAIVFWLRIIEMKIVISRSLTCYNELNKV